MGEEHEFLDIMSEAALESGKIEYYKHFEIEYINSIGEYSYRDMEVCVSTLVMTILNDKSARDSDEISKYIEAEFVVFALELLASLDFKSVIKDKVSAKKLREYYHEGYEYKIKCPTKNSEQELFLPAVCQDQEKAVIYAKDKVKEFMDELGEDFRPVCR